MPQPPEVRAAADRLTAFYQDTQRSLENQIADAATSPAARPRLQALLAQVTAEVTELRGNVAGWLTTDMPAVYAIGAQGAAASAGTEFAWIPVHREAVQALAERTWEQAAATLLDVDTGTRRTIRRLLDDNVRAQILEGLPRGGRQLAEALRAETGLASVTYRNGAVHAMGDYADTLARTDAALAHNSGTFTQLREDAIEWVELVDGPACGLTSHNDGTLANGMVLPIDEAMQYPLAHPRCARSILGRPDVTSQGEADEAAPDPAAQAQAAAEETERARTRLVTGERVGSLGRQPRTPRTPRVPRSAG